MDCNPTACKKKIANKVIQVEGGNYCEIKSTL